MDRLIVKLKRLFLLFGDLAVFYASLSLAILARNRLPRHVTPVTWNDHLLPFSIVFILWLLTSYLLGLYTIPKTRNDWAFFRRAAAALALNTIIAVAFFYLLPETGITPRATLLFDVAATALLWAAWRALAHSLVIERAFRTRVAFVGWNDETAEVADFIRANPSLGYDVVAVITENYDRLTFMLKEQNVHLVVLAASPRTTPELARPLYESVFLKIGFSDVIQFYESLLDRVPTSAITRVWFLENLREADKRMYDTMKRAADAVLAVTLGIPALLLAPLLTLAIRLDSRGPALFRQRRFGRDGKEFDIIKFRSMRMGAEADGAQWAQKKDDRVTRVGRVLRALRLDELPQLWNVLRGDMSFVGPRPERPEFVRELTAEMPYYAMRHLVRPGLTGWAQVNMGYASTVAENLRKLQYDLFYVKYRSLFVDFLILLRTIRTVLTARGQ